MKQGQQDGRIRHLAFSVAWAAVVTTLLNTWVIHVLVSMPLTTPPPHEMRVTRGQGWESFTSEYLWVLTKPLAYHSSNDRGANKILWNQYVEKVRLKTVLGT